MKLKKIKRSMSIMTHYLVVLILVFVSTIRILVPGVISEVFHSRGKRGREIVLKNPSRKRPSSVALQPAPTEECCLFPGILFMRQAQMLDNPEAMLSGDHSDLKKPCRTTCPVKVGSTPANCPPLEPGASCAVGHQVSRGHADGHTHELRGCHHAGRELLCWGRQRPAL